MFNKKFVRRSLNEVKTYKNYSDIMRGGEKKNTIVNIIIIVFCIIAVGYAAKYAFLGAKYVAGVVAKGAVQVASKSLGKEMKKDDYGNINMMIVGYGGQGHAGSFLADSLMLASWNPKIGAVTMISVPRDLYIHDEQQRMSGRVNEVFAIGAGRERNVISGALAMKDQLQRIFGIDIPYYAMVDFQGFESVIDTLGGVEVDVPKTIHDTTYPLDEKRIMTFHVNSGLNLFDGKTALMYARSRHSTSDFDRSQRQQQIIKAILQKVQQQGVGPSKLKELYKDYTKMVTTNIQMDEMLWTAQYLSQQPQIFSYGLTTECSDRARKFSYPGCFLYAPDRALFGGAAVMIPIGVEETAPNASFYDYIQNFAFYTMHNQEYLLEKPDIVIRNAIDKQYTKINKLKQDGYANKVAVKLRKYAFHVEDTQNAPFPSSGNTLYILATGNYEHTITMMKTFFPIEQIKDITKEQPTNPSLLNELYTQQASGTDLVLSLGNSYATYLKEHRFNYYK